MKKFTSLLEINITNVHVFETLNNWFFKIIIFVIKIVI